MQLSVWDLLDYGIAFDWDYMHQADTNHGTIANLNIKFYLDQDTNVDKRKISHCSSRAVA